ncbi:rhodanese-like domain-containing protein [Lacihabitans soyangensis]|uniref:Rhodanese-like domain-containing protein n=1 Tax=Lacihabitans soyangensis TaxID=869394 RepID=A0AAE3KVS4_9BACT|nr:rhodanese-like domain-containing protein [Lacihabitans soyangensis]MCP9764526.1 rhodanese-like domain-containing protein [Lacihabitans soyangensis]
MKEIIEIGLSEIQKIPNSIIIDIREKEEYLEQNIGGINIPAHEITTRLIEISNKENLIIVCSNGLRSSIMARVIHKKIPTANVYHLSEGIFQ